jgi:1-acyl-sn-glycerol-3-phosphate acyltransferase
VRVIGAEHIPSRGAALLVANHVSHFDPVVLSVVAYRLGRQVRPIAVQELFDKPVLGNVAKVLGWIPVSYGRGTDVLTEARQALARGDLVLIYPEGTIPTPGIIAPARRGAAVIAVSARVPVIPIGTAGLEAHVRLRPWRRQQATVRIGHPIQHSALEKVAIDSGYRAASELLLEIVRNLTRAHSHSDSTG